VKLKAVILENFRAYRSRQIIPIGPLTAFIGRNDAGKSSILEALDIFFEGGTIKIESADGSKGGNEKHVCIGVVFNDLPAQLVLDSRSPTTLAAEHLLNADGDLEIHKIFDCSIATPRAQIFALAVHPTEQGAADVLQKVQKDLKAIVKAKGLETQCNQTENPSMRQAIYRSFADLKLQPSDVPLNEDNGKAIWKALQEYLPFYALFQSDRPSSDQDPEVQNPMKVAVEQALEQLTQELDAISDEVRKKAEDTANRTLAKLQANYPNLASTLKPNFKKPAWKSIFKLDLEADDGIPLNKRGSGVRRLVLLSFFQAEAEKKRMATTGTQARSVIYAIEEPETSQHPDSQEQIIRVLRDLADAGDQVVLTTHVPALAGLVPLNSLHYVDRDPTTREVRVRQGTPAVYDEIAAGLGVLPDPLRGPGLRIAVLVEGKNDIDALRSMAAVLTAAGEIANYDDGKIFWTIGGGDALKDWIERRYLDRLNLPQVIIRDSDRSAAILPLKQSTAQWLQDTNALPNVSAFITNKRNMDNYIHPDVLLRLTNGQLVMPATIDWDFDRMAETLSPCLEAAMLAGLKFRPDDHDGTHIQGSNKGSCKKIISSYFMRHMTADEFRQRAAYTNAAGIQANEILEWFAAITVHLA
jgi:predicted ATPase